VVKVSPFSMMYEWLPIFFIEFYLGLILLSDDQSGDSLINMCGAEIGAKKMDIFGLSC